MIGSTWLGPLLATLASAVQRLELWCPVAICAEGVHHSDTKRLTADPYRHMI